MPPEAELVYMSEARKSDKVDYFLFIGSYKARGVRALKRMR